MPPASGYDNHIDAVTRRQHIHPGKAGAGAADSPLSAAQPCGARYVTLLLSRRLGSHTPRVKPNRYRCPGSAGQAPCCGPSEVSAADQSDQTWSTSAPYSASASSTTWKASSTA